MSCSPPSEFLAANQFFTVRSLAPVHRLTILMARAAARRLSLAASRHDVARIRLAENNGVSFDAYQFETLDALFGMAARVALLEAA
jgi:hypothetical protein